MTPAERPCDETIRLALSRILESKDFQRSERLRAFLAYVVEKEAIGEGMQLKGYSIAVDVFGRSQSFDADSDPLVRVHAGKLRKLLKVFYETEGRNDEWQIVIPKGTYVPTYRRGGTTRTVGPALPEAAGAQRHPRRPSWQPPPFSSPWAVLTVLPLLLFAAPPALEMPLGLEAEAKLTNGPLARVRGLPSVSVSVRGPQHENARHFAESLHAAALRYPTLAQAEMVGSTHASTASSQPLSFSAVVAWENDPEPGIRVTLRHDGEDIPLREEFVAAKQLAGESDILFESTSLAAQFFAIDGEIYAHAAVEGLQSILMECMATTTRYKKLLTRASFQQAWECQQKLRPLKGDEPLFIISTNAAHEHVGH